MNRFCFSSTFFNRAAWCILFVFLYSSCNNNPDKKSGPPSTLQPHNTVSASLETRTPEPKPEKTVPVSTQQPRKTVSTSGEIHISELKPEKLFPDQSPTRKKLDEKPFAEIDGDDLNELSGIIAASRRGEFWGHNDKGNKSDLYRFNLRGDILQKVKLESIKNEDWEAITRDGEGNLCIGDFGDNDKERGTYFIYQVQEPRPGAKKLTKFKKNAFVYSGGQPNNCEAFFVMDRTFYLITKEDSEDTPSLYRIDNLSEKKLNAARKIAPFNITGKVTDAAYSAPYRLLAVLTYSGITFYRIEKPSDLLSMPIHFVKADFDQCEGLCFDGNYIIVTNESGDIWRYSIDFLLDW